MGELWMGNIHADIPLWTPPDFTNGPRLEPNTSVIYGCIVVPLIYPLSDILCVFMINIEMRAGRKLSQKRSSRLKIEQWLSLQRWQNQPRQRERIIWLVWVSRHLTSGDHRPKWCLTVIYLKIIVLLHSLSVFGPSNGIQICVTVARHWRKSRLNACKVSTWS